MRRYFRSFLAATAFLVVIPLTACAGVTIRTGNAENSLAVLNQSAEQARAAGADANAKALEDGELTFDEYMAAAGRYRECARSAGFDLGDPVLSPVDGVTLEWSIPSDVFTSSADIREDFLRCERQWTPMLISYVATTPNRMDPQLLRTVRQCLQKAGYETPDDAVTFRDLAGHDDSEEGLLKIRATSDCIQSNVLDLFPELERVGLTIQG